MSRIKISQLPQVPSQSITDSSIFILVVGSQSYKMTFQQLREYILPSSTTTTTTEEPTTTTTTEEPTTTTTTEEPTTTTTTEEPTTTTTTEEPTTTTTTEEPTTTTTTEEPTTTTTTEEPTTSTTTEEPTTTTTTEEPTTTTTTEEPTTTTTTEEPTTTTSTTTEEPTTTTTSTTTSLSCCNCVSYELENSGITSYKVNYTDCFGTPQIIDMQIGTLSLCSCENTITYDSIFVTHSSIGNCYNSCSGTCSNYIGTAQDNGTINFIPCWNDSNNYVTIDFVNSQNINICACGNGMSPDLQNSEGYQGPTYSGSIVWEPLDECECFVTTTTSTTTSNEPNIWTMYECPLGCGFDPDPPYGELRGCFFDTTTIQTTTISVWTQPQYSSPSLFTIGMTFSGTSDLSTLYTSTSYLSFTNSIDIGSGIIYQLDGSYALVATYSIGTTC